MMKTNHKTWIISEHYYPCSNTTSYIMTKISEGLSANLDVNVITPGGSGKDYKNINGVRIFYVKDSQLDKNNFIQRIIKLILLGIRLFFRAGKLIKRDDNVLVVTNPAPIIFLLGVLRVFKNFRLFFLVHDVFPENLVVAKVLKESNAFYRLTLKIFNWSYKKAEKLLVIGRDMAEFMKKKLGNDSPEIIYIPNFTDTHEIFPQQKEDNFLSLKYGIVNKLVILFTGNIGWAQDIENILSAMLLLKNNTDIHLLMIGGGAKYSSVEHFIKEHRLRNITLLPHIDRSQSNLFLNAGDIGLVSLQTGRKGIGIPSKTYSYLAAGKPILGAVDKGSEIELVIRESECGWWIPPGDPAALAESILRINTDRNDILAKSYTARKIAENKYALERVIPEIKNLLNGQNH